MVLAQTSAARTRAWVADTIRAVPVTELRAAIAALGFLVL